MIQTKKRTLRMYNTWACTGGGGGGYIFFLVFYWAVRSAFPLFFSLFFCSTGIETCEEFYFVRGPAIGQYKFDIGEEIREEAKTTLLFLSLTGPHQEYRLQNGGIQVGERARSTI